MFIAKKRKPAGVLVKGSGPGFLVVQWCCFCFRKMNTALPSEAMEIATTGYTFRCLAKSIFLLAAWHDCSLDVLQNVVKPMLAHADGYRHQDPTFLDWQDVREHDPAFVAANPPTRNCFNSETEYQEALQEHQERIRRGITCKTCNPPGNEININ